MVVLSIFYIAKKCWFMASSKFQQNQIKNQFLENKCIKEVGLVNWKKESKFAIWMSHWTF